MNTLKKYKWWLIGGVVAVVAYEFWKSKQAATPAPTPQAGLVNNVLSAIGLKKS